MALRIMRTTIPSLGYSVSFVLIKACGIGLTNCYTDRLRADGNWAMARIGLMAAAEKRKLVSLR